MPAMYPFKSKFLAFKFSGETVAKLDRIFTVSI